MDLSLIRLALEPLEENEPTLVDENCKEEEITGFHSLPFERKAQIFNLLPFHQQILVSYVCLDWAVVVQNASTRKFYATLDNDTAKFIADRYCPLETLTIENWTSILRDDFDMDTVLTPVSQLELMGGIPRSNKNKILSSCGGSVVGLTFHKEFFLFMNSFPANPCLNWENLCSLILMIPGGDDPTDCDHLTFMNTLLRNSHLPNLTELAVELGRSIGADVSRVNRNGRFTAKSLTTFTLGLFAFIARHKKSLQNLKLYFLCNVIPNPDASSGNGDEVTEGKSDLEAELSELSYLRRIQVRYYNNRNFDIPLLRQLVKGSSILKHLEYEQQGSLYPEVYAAVERNAKTLTTLILEIRMDDETSLPANDIFSHLDCLRNCIAVKTLHLRGLGVGLVSLNGIPPTVSTLRICTNDSGDVQLGWLAWVSLNLTNVTVLEVGDTRNDLALKLSKAVYRRRLQERFTLIHFVETNYVGDYVKQRDILHWGY